MTVRYKKNRDSGHFKIEKEILRRNRIASHFEMEKRIIERHRVARYFERGKDVNKDMSEISFLNWGIIKYN